jgi:riboflavin synthase
MFTGLIQRMGTLLEKRSFGQGIRLVIGVEPPFESLDMGESVAVDGACLTVVVPDPARFAVEVSPESLVRTSLASRRPGQPVNLERALRLSDRLGGHLVTGHVDCTGRVVGVAQRGSFVELSFEVPAEAARLVVEKGSVTLDGVSLTVASCQGNRFTVALIPATLDATTLRDRRTGDVVNVETDILGKYVEKLLSGRTGGPGTDDRLHKLLAQSGFIRGS